MGGSPVALWRSVRADPRWYFSEEEVARSKAYQRPLQRASMLGSVLSTVLAVAFVAGRVGPRLLHGGDLDWPVQLVVVFAVFSVAETLLGLPLAIWRTFVHEEKWGFNRQRPAGFAADAVKSFVLNLVLFSVLLVPIWALIRSTDLWWIYAGLLVIVLVVVLQFLGPVTILRLFNRFSPLEDQELRRRLDDLVARAGATVREYFVMDASKRSTKDNAAVTGLGKTQRVIIFDNLLEMPAEQVEVVIAHELGHWRRRHVIQGLAFTLVLAVTALAAAAALLRWEEALAWAGVRSLGDPAALPLFLLTMGVALAVLQYAAMWWSRWKEREADLDALELTGDPAVFQDLWRSMSGRNLPDLDPSWFARIRASHPPVAERMAFGDMWATARDGDR